MGINLPSGNNTSDSGMPIRPQKSERLNKAFDVESVWPKSYSFPWDAGEAITESIPGILPFDQAIEKLKTQYKFVQVDEISTFLRHYPLLIADLHRIYKIKSRHFDESPMDLYYISETGSLESANLVAYIKINIPREKAEDIFSLFDEEWWSNISKKAKTLLMVDMVKNV